MRLSRASAVHRRFGTLRDVSPGVISFRLIFLNIYRVHWSYVSPTVLSSTRPRVHHRASSNTTVFLKSLFEKITRTSWVYASFQAPMSDVCDLASLTASLTHDTAISSTDIDVRGEATSWLLGSNENPSLYSLSFRSLRLLWITLLVRTCIHTHASLQVTIFESRAHFV